MKRNWIKPAALIALVLGLLALLLFFRQTGLLSSLSSPQALRAYIQGFAPYTHIAFFLVQMSTVALAPIPSNVISAAGGLLFGMWQGFFLSASAVLAASMVVFSLSKALGKPFADKIVAKKVSEKYLSVIERKRDVFLVLAFVMPFFPDDILCLLAGLTDIGHRRFFLLILFTRPWGLFFSAMVGSSAITVPLWGWALIAIGFAGLFVLGMKYGDRIERAVLKKLGK